MKTSQKQFCIHVVVIHAQLLKKLYLYIQNCLLRHIICACDLFSLIVSQLFDRSDPLLQISSHMSRPNQVDLYIFLEQGLKNLDSYVMTTMLVVIVKSLINFGKKCLIKQIYLIKLCSINIIFQFCFLYMICCSLTFWQQHFLNNVIIRKSNIIQY